MSGISISTYSVQDLPRISKTLRRTPNSVIPSLWVNKLREWQNKDYVLGYFGTTERDARNNYLSFVAEGVEAGKRSELVGGGLLRSVGGWKGLKELRGVGEKVRGDERILGGSKFLEPEDIKAILTGSQ